MTKREIEYEEEVVELNHLIAQMNGRAKALKYQLDLYDRDWKALKKRLDRHFKKYGVNNDTE